MRGKEEEVGMIVALFLLSLVGGAVISVVLGIVITHSIPRGDRDSITVEIPNAP